MSKLLLLVIIGLAIAGIFTGVFEVKVNFEKLGDLPSTLQTTIGANAVTQAEYYFTTWKRKAEVSFAKSDDKKFELFMRYVENDTETLKDALDVKKGPDTIILRSKLLNESLVQAKEGIEKISDEALGKIRDAWLKVLASANSELGRLSGVADEYKKFQEQIEKIAPAPSTSPTPKIELKF